MRIIIVGAGIGGLTTALALHRIGITVEIYEQARELAELGVGINILPPATHVLAGFGLLPDLDRCAIRTRQLVYMNHLGQEVWRETRGRTAGHGFPQFSIHRGRLHALLARTVCDRIGGVHLHTGCAFVGLHDYGTHVVARFKRRLESGEFEARGDALVGCDGIHSAVRARLYPDEGAPAWSGIMLWRGAVDWPAHADGRTMVIAGGSAAKFVFYPIAIEDDRPDRRLTNWGVMARVGRAGDRPPRREDWNRQAERVEVLRFVREKFALPFVDPSAIIEATHTCYEFPNCDRDPLRRWSFGRVTLLGDAAHPMYPVGSNGGTQAILDAEALARNLSQMPVIHALTAYEAERRPITTQIVLSNRQGGPERVIDLIEARAPNGFDDLDGVCSYEERRQIVRGYRALTANRQESLTERSSMSPATSRR